MRIKYIKTEFNELKDIKRKIKHIKSKMYSNTKNKKINNVKII